MKKIIIAIFISVLTLPGSAGAFYDEVEALRSDLEGWKQSRDVDFSDILDVLQNIGPTSFNDVEDMAWYATYVNALAEWGIVSGYKDSAGRRTGEFKPQNAVTIAEILKMAMGASKVSVEACTGVPGHPEASGHWAEQFVACAEEMGVRIVRDRESLDRPATRAEVITIIHDVFGDQVFPIFASYEDTVGHRFETDIAFATLNGIVSGDIENGFPTGTFRPDDEVNRAEAAKIVFERLRRDVESEGQTPELATQSGSVVE